MIAQRIQSYLNGRYYRKIFQRQTDRITRLRKILEDDRSVEVLDLLLKSYTTVYGNSDYYYRKAAEDLSEKNLYKTMDDRIIRESLNMYFRDEIHRFTERFNLNRKMILLDGGAYNGDTLIAASKLGKKMGSFHIAYAYAFEPDPSNYQLLEKNANSLPFPVELYNSGLDDHDGEEDFCWEGVRTRINSDGGIFGPGNSFSDRRLPVINAGGFLDNLRCTDTFASTDASLNETLTVAKPLPNFIKLDIEGREREVLLSMSGYIRDYHPDLAVSIYHRPEDLWNIPLIIYSICSNYKIYIRHNSDYYTETVCHAVYAT